MYAYWKTIDSFPIDYNILLSIVFHPCHFSQYKHISEFCIHHIWLIMLYFILIPKLSLSFSSFTRVLLYKKKKTKTKKINNNNPYHHITPNKFPSPHITHPQQKTHTYTHIHLNHLHIQIKNKKNTNV